MSNRRSWHFWARQWANAKYFTQKFKGTTNCVLNRNSSLEIVSFRTKKLGFLQITFGNVPQTWSIFHKCTKQFPFILNRDIPCTFPEGFLAFCLFPTVNIGGCGGQLVQDIKLSQFIWTPIARMLSGACKWAFKAGCLCPAINYKRDEGTSTLKPIVRNALLSIAMHQKQKSVHNVVLFQFFMLSHGGIILPKKLSAFVSIDVKSILSFVPWTKLIVSEFSCIS